MRKLAITITAFALLAAPAAASAVEVATGPYVVSHLIHHTNTPDGVRIRSADCSPNPSTTWEIRGGRVLAHSWLCTQVDRLNRELWTRVRVTGGTFGVVAVEYRCSAKYSFSRCP